VIATVAPTIGVFFGAIAMGIGAAVLDDDGEIAAPFVVLIVLFGYGVPICMVSVVAGLVTVRIIRGRWTSARPGHCSRCDYDLAGLESGGCPECGLPMKRESPGESDRASDT
jgi:hypothetical protein